MDRKSGYYLLYYDVCKLELIKETAFLKLVHNLFDKVAVGKQRFGINIPNKSAGVPNTTASQYEEVHALYAS